MHIWSRLLLFSLAASLLGCGEQKPATPLETFKTYAKAAKQKDTATMKLLLSDATLKMHEQEAKAQGTSVDDILTRETMIGENQRSIEYRDEKVEGDRATLQVKNVYGSWENLPFVREDGVWKIDKQGYAEQIIRDIENQQDQKFDELRGIGSQSPAP
jgi:hypothetical protein